MITCTKCQGTGYISSFSYYANGTCFDCQGTGKVKTSKKKSSPTCKDACDSTVTLIHKSEPRYVQFALWNEDQKKPSYGKGNISFTKWVKDPYGSRGFWVPDGDLVEKSLEELRVDYKNLIQGDYRKPEDKDEVSRMIKKYS